jgi:hypothetical protein
LGYGTYEGDFIVGDETSTDPPPVGAVAEMHVALNAAREEGRFPLMRNPRIRLDNGSVVWGCECWWGSEAGIRDMIEKRRAEGFEIRELDMNQVREKFLANKKAEAS